MPKTRSDSRSSWEENVGILLDELDLAIHWTRPSILLAVHKSKFGHEKAQKALAERLRKLGQRVKHIIVNNERPDVPHLIIETIGVSTAEKTVFFVSNLDSGGGENGKEAYRALNIYREFFVEYRIKAVFWLTTDEAANLPRYAPDFWAFRHRVVEFASSRATKGIHLPAGILLWDIQDSTRLMEIDTVPMNAPQERRARLKDQISERERMLAKLPQKLESLSARIELLYNLGYLHWRLDNSTEATAAFTAGLKLGQDHVLPGITARLLHGIAVLDYQVGNYAPAAESYKKAIALSPQDSALLINLSAACCMLGRNHEAISISKRALRIKATDATIWNRLGYIYIAMGKLAEAVTCLVKAAELAPKIAAFHESLAIAYRLLARLDESKRELGIADRLSGKNSEWQHDLYEEAILGSPEKALESLRAAVIADRIFSYEVQRDPNLNLLFDASQIDELLHNLAGQSSKA